MGILHQRGNRLSALGVVLGQSNHPSSRSEGTPHFFVCLSRQNQCGVPSERGCTAFPFPGCCTGRIGYRALGPHGSRQGARFSPWAANAQRVGAMRSVSKNPRQSAPPDGDQPCSGPQFQTRDQFPRPTKNALTKARAFWVTGCCKSLSRGKRCGTHCRSG